ncbi:uncharacterized protein LOC129597827 [Paramacrobiotus metropolitanus]|uniref:uncharacterized protein LOC129597827 n=1 Tax=Paramacrobiotus metropolitanus TaxID=2943436 RepID=UPI00244564A0|nr:uncharacterized protein LOC129597827 [Paramacrobiotus metropolitanus]
MGLCEDNSVLASRIDASVWHAIGQTVACRQKVNSVYSRNIDVHKNAQGEFPALGFFLVCSGPSGYPKSDTWACQATLELRLLPWNARTHLFCKNGDNMGYRHYISMETLLDPAKGYINPHDFSLRLQIQLTADLPTGVE